MLCYYNSNNGNICTNRCEIWDNCTHRKSPSHMKIPFLVEVVDRLISEIKPEIINGIHVITYKPYCYTPQAFLNGATDEITQDDTCDMRLS